jgi:hypothetical protein
LWFEQGARGGTKRKKPPAGGFSGLCGGKSTISESGSRFRV